MPCVFFFFFNDTATTEIYTLSLHDALPISGWHPTTYTVTVRLQDIVSHNCQPSYRKMADFYVNRRGVAKMLHFKFGVLPGGSVPGWNPQGRSVAGTLPTAAQINELLSRGDFLDFQQQLELSR